MYLNEMCNKAQILGQEDGLKCMFRVLFVHRLKKLTQCTYFNSQLFWPRV